MPRIKLDKPDPRIFLVKQKYPHYFREDFLPDSTISLNVRRKIQQNDPAAEKYFSDLQKLPLEKVEAMRQEIIDKQNEEIKKRKIEEEKARFYNQSSSNADLKYWAKMAEWTIEEATALCFGKDPQIVEWEKLKQFYSDSAFVREYSKIHTLIERAKKSNAFSNSSSPIPKTKTITATSHDPLSETIIASQKMTGNPESSSEGPLP